MQNPNYFCTNLIITYNGKESEKVYVYTYVITESLCYTPEANTKL